MRRFLNVVILLLLVCVSGSGSAFAAATLFDKQDNSASVQVFNRYKDGFRQLPLCLCYTSLSEELVEAGHESCDESESHAQIARPQTELFHSEWTNQFHSYQKRALYLMYKCMQIDHLTV